MNDRHVVTDRLPVEVPHGIAPTGAAVWLGAETDDGTDVLTRLDPRDPATAVQVQLPGNLVADDAVAVGPGGVWAVTHDAHLLRVDPATNEVMADIAVDGDALELTVGDDAAWGHRTWLRAPADRRPKRRGHNHRPRR